MYCFVIKLLKDLKIFLQNLTKRYDSIFLLHIYAHSAVYCKDSNITPGGYTKISSDFEGGLHSTGGYIRGGLYSNLYSTLTVIFQE